MPTQNPEGRYFCERCTHRYDDVGDCPSCPEEPLLDLIDEDVLLMLRSFDDERWRRRMGVCTMVAAAVCLPLLLIPLRKITFFLYGGATTGLAGVFVKMYPPAQKTPDMGQNH